MVITGGSCTDEHNGLTDTPSYRDGMTHRKTKGLDVFLEDCAQGSKVNDVPFSQK